ASASSTRSSTMSRRIVLSFGMRAGPETKGKVSRFNTRRGRERPWPGSAPALQRNAMPAAAGIMARPERSRSGPAMAVEIERKFLLAGDRWRASVERTQAMAQGYLNDLAAVAGGTQKASVRVRIEGAAAFVNIKSAQAGRQRL